MIFDTMDMNTQKFAAKIINFVLQEEIITIDKLIREEICESKDVAEQAIVLMENIGILKESVMQNALDVRIAFKEWRNIIRTSEQLHPDIRALLATHGYDMEELENEMNALTPIKKKVLSKLLNDRSFQWKSIHEKQVPEHEVVVIRMVDESRVMEENALEIHYVEDIKLATMELVDDEPVWKILPPHPRFDYSLLSNKENLKPGVEVTHWDFASKEHIQDWQNRFKPIGKYDWLNLEVSEEKLKDVYDALMWGAFGLLGPMYQEADEETQKRLEKYHTVLSDLQAILDANKPIGDPSKNIDLGGR